MPGLLLPVFSSHRIAGLPAISAYLGTIIVLTLAVIALILLNWRQRRASLASLEHLAKDWERIGSLLRSSTESPDHLAEAAYLEAASLARIDRFRMGVYEGERFRTLIVMEDGVRKANEVIEIGADSHRALSAPIEDGRPLIFDHDPEAQGRAQATDPAFRSEMYVPITIGEKLVAALILQSHTPQAYPASLLPGFGHLAKALASALTILTLNAEAERRSRNLVLLGEISRQLLALRPINEAFNDVASLIAQAYGPAQVNLYDLNGEELNLLASAACDLDPGCGDLQTADSLARQCISESRTVLPDSSIIDAERSTELGTPVAGVASPLKVENRTLGAIQIIMPCEERFPADQVPMVEMLAGQLAIAALESRNFASLREESWINSVLLEVARHAARVGPTEEALQSVLQLTTLVAGTGWALLLLPDEDEGDLRVGPIAGLPRHRLDALAQVVLERDTLGLHDLQSDSAIPALIQLPQALRDSLDAEHAAAFALGDGNTLLGVLLASEAGMVGARSNLLTGIAHQISLRLEVSRLASKAAVQQALEHELAMAHEIQVNFLPKEPPHHAGWEVGVSWHAAREVAGDFYDFIPLEPGQWGTRWGVVIADVAGKGVPASLFMAMTRSLLRSVALTHIDPGLTLRRLNNLLCSDNQNDLFVSVFYAVWEPEFARLSYSNAGHNPPLFYPSSGEPRWLTEHGLVLGVQSEAPFPTNWLEFSEGDLLVMYTDGVTEAPREDGEIFGEERLQDVIMRLEKRQAQLAADSLVFNVKRYIAEPSLHDDLTIVALLRGGSNDDL